MNRDIEKLILQYDDKAPLSEASTIPACWYTNESIGVLERDRVFGSTWQAVGRTDQVEQAGQFFTTDIGGEPVVVVRAGDGRLHGFFNVCRHHAASVATAPSGLTQLFRCPYHGWTYGLDGALKGTPDFAGVCNFDRKENGLVPIRVAVWEQFVFVCLDPDASPLEEYLGDLPGRIKPLQLSRLRFRKRQDYVLQCNWKVFVDNYLDGGYHVPYVHESLNSVLEYAQYTIENGTRYCLQSSPLVKSGEQSAVESTRNGERAWYFWLFPNFMMNVYEGVMDTNLVLPLGIDKTRVIFDFYFDGEAADSADASIAVSDVVQQEDVGVCEAVQRGLSSRAYNAGRLSVRREAGEHLFHQLLARALKSPPRP